MAVEITDAGPCKKHIKVSIPRSEIELQYTESLENLRKEAVVPGFRPGKAPRQLVVKRFRKQVSEQVKSKLLMSSLEQLDQDYKLEPITQPQLDVAAIELPDDGPMNFEMDVEVRPQFTLPELQGPVTEATRQDDHRLGHRDAAPNPSSSATVKSCRSSAAAPNSAITSRPTSSLSTRPVSLDRDQGDPSSDSSPRCVSRTARFPRIGAQVAGRQAGREREVDVPRWGLRLVIPGSGARRSPCGHPRPRPEADAPPRSSTRRS